MDSKKIIVRRLSLFSLIFIVAVIAATSVKSVLLTNGLSTVYSTKEVPIVVMIMVLMVLCWIFEVFPLWFTSMMPLVIAPIFGLMTVSQLAPYYCNEITFLFLSGFLIGQVISEWNLHLWFSQLILTWTRSSMVATWVSFTLIAFLLSMWIANIVAALMLISVAEGLLAEIKANAGERWQEYQPYAKATVLSIAYASSLGGISTLIGTAPNALLSCFLQESSGGTNLDMFIWFKELAPLSLLLLLVLIMYMYYFYIRHVPTNHLTLRTVHQRKKMEKLSMPQLIILIVFGLVIFLWMGKQLLVSAFGVSFLSDAWIGMLGVGLLNIIPASRTPNKRIMSSQAIRCIPWDILILIGGGLCLAKMMSLFHVDRLMADQLAKIPFHSPVILIAFAVVFMNLMTEVTSNTAITIASLPVFYSIAQGNHFDVLTILIPVTVSASMAFMLPTATPPNAIAYATGYIDMKGMVKAGSGFKFLVMGICLIYFSF